MGFLPRRKAFYPDDELFTPAEGFLPQRWCDIQACPLFFFEQFSGFIDQPPEWFLVTPLDESLFLDLLRIPPYVTMPGGQLKNIEWADAIHLATSLSRENCLLATTDSRLKQLTDFQNHII